MTAVRRSYHEVLPRTIRRQLGEYRGEALEVETYDVGCTLYRDLIELGTAIAGVGEYTWVDAEGRRTRSRGAARSALRLAREAAWDAPGSYMRHRIRVARLSSAVNHLDSLLRLDRGLFIRSDHSYGVVAGGSVGHLSGVIHGLRGMGIALPVISSDWLAGVPADSSFHRVLPSYEPVRNVPELPRLNYNEQLMAYCSRGWSDWSPQFIYHRYSQHDYIGPWLRARFRVPYVCEYNGSFIWMNRHWGPRPLYFERLADRVELLNLRAADLVVVVSQPMADEVIGRGVAPGRVLVNPNGVDTEIYRPDVSANEVRQRYGIDECLVVGFIGTFGPWHGAEKLAEAAALVHQRHVRADDGRPLHFLLIGEGNRMKEVQRIVAEAGLANVVTLTGRVPQADGPAHLAACDILASPHVPNPDGTPFFGSPTKLFEYMAMGRPIVASSLDQIADVLDHAQTAWLVDPGNAEALAAGITHLAGDKGLRSRLGARARDRARTHHTWDRHVRLIMDALHSVLDSETAAA